MTRSLLNSSYNDILEINTFVKENSDYERGSIFLFWKIFLNKFLLNFVQVSYAIGVAEPISITVFDYGTSDKTPSQLIDIVKRNFDLRPGMIVKELNLKAPIFRKTRFVFFAGIQWDVCTCLRLFEIGDVLLLLRCTLSDESPVREVFILLGNF